MTGNLPTNWYQRFEANRARWTNEQLHPHLGHWVFFTRDGTRILASAAELSDAYAALAAAGVQPDDTVLDHLVVESGSEVGGAQWA